MVSPATPATKAARQARIAAILSREQVHSQEQLAALLDRYARRPLDGPKAVAVLFAWLLERP